MYNIVLLYSVRWLSHLREALTWRFPQVERWQPLRPWADSKVHILSLTSLVWCTLTLLQTLETAPVCSSLASCSSLAARSTCYSPREVWAVCTYVALYKDYSICRIGASRYYYSYCSNVKEATCWRHCLAEVSGCAMLLEVSSCWPTASLFKTLWVPLIRDSKPICPWWCVHLASSPRHKTVNKSAANRLTIFLD
jgi:hypothetical protein